MLNDKNSELVFFNVYGFYLQWTKQSFFSYLSTPRPNHGLMYILCDRVHIEYRGGDIETFEKGNLIYIPEGLFYSVKFSGEGEHLDALLLNFSASGDLQPCNRVKRLKTEAGADYTEPFYKIISLYTQTKNYRYGVMEQFYRLLDKISSHIERRGAPEYKDILPAITYANSHINERIYVPDLAKLCLLSETAFRKRFLACTGKTPTKYITDLKIEKAKELLKSSDITIEAIVTQLGFYDSAHFHKVFKRECGISPSDFRAKNERF